MTLTIKYFGVIAEETGTHQEIVTLDSADLSVDSLKEYCVSKYSLSDPESIQVAVNQNMDHAGGLDNGDEVAFLPPFSGG
jgi:molybdopterin synthase sulfur carrier subunit